MTVRYIRVNAISDLFAPKSRAYGTIAIVGPAAAGPEGVAVAFTNPSDALAAFPGDLGESIKTAFAQKPGAALIYGVRTAAAGPDWGASLDVLSTIDAQIIALANVPLDAANTAAITSLSNHVTTVSQTQGDGKERIGVVMLAKGATATAIVAGALRSERMVYIAHKSDEDAAAAVAGTIAGYEPHISLLLKPVAIKTDLFTPAEIVAINGVEASNAGPAGNGVNWFTSPSLLSEGVYMGEGYTAGGLDKKFIDIVRTLDDISFRLKARLIKTIGSVRISRTGLRALSSLMEATLIPLVTAGIIESFEIVIPILPLLDKPQPTEAEKLIISNSQDTRYVEVSALVDYAGAIHRLTINLVFK